MNKLHVIGIGYKPLDKMAREALRASTSILASKRLFEVFQGYDEYESVKERVKNINNVDETIAFIATALRNGQGDITLLASGDPLFSGIGRRAILEFGKERVEIIPELSSVQIAFARIREAWDDAFLMSLHGGPDPAKRRRLPYQLEDIPFLMLRHNKIAVLTDRENGPSAIAQCIATSSHRTALSPVIYICERLGYDNEKITEGTPEEIAKMGFSDPNVVIIINGSEALAPAANAHPLSFGCTENEIIHSRGLITKDEVRAVSLHKLRLPESGVLWDIGAGSGSVSIEAANLCRGLKTFAIEKEREQLDNIRRNKVSFDASNVEVVEGTAPEALEGLPSPDRVFIGGSGGRLAEIISLVKKKMALGIVVINAVTLETLNSAQQSLLQEGFFVDVSQIAVSRMKEAGKGNYLSALNPVFIVKGEIGEKENTGKVRKET